LALDALTGLAHVLAWAGEAERALEFSKCVLNHTASTQDAKDRAERLRAKLESQLSQQQIEAVWTQAKTFEAVVEEILAGG
jgi:hypothetical protein